MYVHVFWFTFSHPTTVGEARKADTAAGGDGNPNVSGRMLTMAGLFDVWRRGPNVSELCTA